MNGIQDWVQDHFAAGWWLLALLVVPTLVAAYVWAQRRRSTDVVRFTNLDLLADVAVSAPRWKRHVPAALFLAALAALAVGVARPQGTVRVPRDEATVVLVLDVSGSMLAEDVQPTRLQAAQESALSLVEQLPDRVQVGIVAFSETVRVLAPPTTDRDSVRTAITGLRAQGGTAMGDAILTAVGLVRPEAQAGTAQGAPLDGGATAPETKARIPATVLLLSDGANRNGQAEPLDAADIASSLEVPVYTVALGTADGEAAIPSEDGDVRLVPVPPDPDTLRAVADRTRAAFFEAPTAGELKTVYEDLGRRVGYRSERRDATHVPLEVGFVLLLLSGGLSLAWGQRLP